VILLRLPILFLLFTVGLEIEASVETPVMFKDMKESTKDVPAEPWTAPDYSNQSGALGYGVGTFGVPAGLMEHKVAFWIDIYTKYNTDQGVLHDSRYIDVVYGDVDFTDIMKDEQLNAFQKQRAREKRVKSRKKEIIDRLRRLQRLSSPAGLQGEDLRYWYMFSEVEESRKFAKATSRNRLRFQLGQSDRFVKGIFLSGYYLKHMEEIFREQGVPIELTRLPFVESSFNLKARSRVGASGIWQFMRSSARGLLLINRAADERNAPLEATLAAAKFLKRSYNLLGHWPLAVTGYNHGPAGMKRMVRKYNTTDINELVSERKGRFGFASANFYASFLAALEVERNAAKYFGPIQRAKPLDVVRYKIPKSVDRETVLEWFDGKIERAQFFNPHLTRSFWRNFTYLRQKNIVFLPQAKLSVAQKFFGDNHRLAALERVYIHRVRRGQTLGQIARKFQVKMKRIMRANNISNPSRLSVGQKLVIPR
jgi:membrane-bound lytic murein transglycosylase D